MNAWVWKQVLKHEGEPVLLLSLRRPEPPEGSRALRRVGRYYQRLGEVWQSRWETIVYPRACEALAAARVESRPFQPWSASLDFTVTLEEPDRVSLYLDAVETGAAARPLRVRAGDIWDLKAGAPLPLRALFPPGVRRSGLLRELQRQAQERVDGGEFLLYQDAAARIRRSFSAGRCYLAPEGPVVFYPMEALGSPAEGTPAFPLESQRLLPEKRPKKIH